MDYWINNAGRAVSRYKVHEMDEATVHSLVDGNLKGTISPGMLISDNWFEEQKQMDPAEWPRSRASASRG